MHKHQLLIKYDTISFQKKMGLDGHEWKRNALHFAWGDKAQKGMQPTAMTWQASNKSIRNLPMHDTPKVCGVNWVRFPPKKKQIRSEQPAWQPPIKCSAKFRCQCRQCCEHQEKLNNSMQNFRHPHGDFFPWQEQVAYGPSNILVSLGAGTHATNADAVEDWYLKVAGKAFTRL